MGNFNRGKGSQQKFRRVSDGAVEAGSFNPFGPNFEVEVVPPFDFASPNNWSWLGQCVLRVIARGHAVMVAYSLATGSFSVTIFVDERKFKRYIKDEVDFDRFVDAITSTYPEFEASAGGDVPRPLQKAENASREV
jgi:hypothetical protein